MQKTKYTKALTLISIAFLASCASKQNLNSSQVEQTSRTKTAVSTVMTATTDFINADSTNKIWYIDTERQSLAVDAELFKGQFAVVQSNFHGKSAEYQIDLTTLTETDGESQYRVTIGEQALPFVTNPESSVDFTPYVHQWQNIKVNAGDIITVSFNSATNGKIPEGESTAYARGRWTKLELICTADCN